MTEEIPVHIYMALDRSGSMAAIADDVIGGFNQFIADQKTKPGKCRFTLVQFDSMNPFELVLDAVKLVDVPDLSANTFLPRGGTPLLDAEGRLINQALARETARRDSGKTPEAILFVTYTDGMENSSREWTLPALSAKKKDLSQRWAFTYLGVGHDGYAQAERIGTMSVNTVVGAASAQGVASTYSAYDHNTRIVRDRARKGLVTTSADLAGEQRT